MVDSPDGTRMGAANGMYDIVTQDFRNKSFVEDFTLNANANAQYTLTFKAPGLLYIPRRIYCACQGISRMIVRGLVNSEPFLQLYGDSMVEVKWEPPFFVYWTYFDAVTFYLFNIASVQNVFYLTVEMMECVEPDNWLRRPVSEFTPSDQFVAIGEAVTFDNQSNGTIDSWSWDFGDNTTSTEWSPVHSYSAAGAYNVKLVTVNAAGSDYNSWVIYVT